MMAAYTCHTRMRRRRGGVAVNLKTYSSIAVLAVVLALGGATSTSFAAGPQRAAQQAYGCTIDPKSCQTGVAGTRVIGGSVDNPGTPGGAGNPGGFGSTPGTGKNPGYAKGTRSKGGAKGSRNTGKGSGSGYGKGANALGAGANGNGKNGKGNNGKGANGLGAGANGSSPVPTHGLPVTGFGGTAQDLGASPRASAAGTQPVVVGLASLKGSKGVTSLPATGGGMPSQPGSPLPLFLACVLAALGLGLRKVAARL